MCQNWASSGMAGCENRKSPQIVGLRLLMSWTNFLAGEYNANTEYFGAFATTVP